MPTNEQVVEHLGNMTVMQLCELTRELEAKWGVQAVPQVTSVPGVPLPTTPIVEEQTEFTVILQSVEAAQKIAAIKVVREVSGLGLKEAKDIIDGLPKTLKEGISKADAEEIQKKFEAAGVKVTVQ